MAERSVSPLVAGAVAVLVLAVVWDALSGVRRPWPPPPHTMAPPETSAALAVRRHSRPAPLRADRGLDQPRSALPIARAVRYRALGTDRSGVGSGRAHRLGDGHAGHIRPQGPPDDRRRDSGRGDSRDRARDRPGALTGF